MSDAEDNAQATAPDATEAPAKRTRKTSPMRCFEMSDEDTCRPFGPEFKKITAAREFLNSHVAENYTSDEDEVPTFTIQRVLGTFNFQRKTTVAFVEV